MTLGRITQTSKPLVNSYRRTFPLKFPHFFPRIEKKNISRFSIVFFQILECQERSRYLPSVKFPKFGNLVFFFLIFLFFGVKKEENLERSWSIRINKRGARFPMWDRSADFLGVRQGMLFSYHGIICGLFRERRPDPTPNPITLQV